MLFHTFNSQEERRAYGGSAFTEIQFCKLPSNTALKKIVAIGNVKFWEDDSLYVDDEYLFYKEYGQILDGVIHNNLESGTVDLYGINYCPPAAIDAIIGQINEARPVEYERFIAWLIQAKQYNGFYILGL